MSELPKGWGKAYVSELVENSKSDIVDGPFGSNLKATEYIESGVPIARIQNVKRFIFNKTNRKFVSEEKYKQLIRHTYMGGDILLTKLGEPLGLACIVPHTEPNGVIVADLVRIRPNSEITNTKYLEYVLNSQEVIIQIASHVKGSTRARINLSVVRGLSVPLAPLAEQKRIVEKLDQVLAQVDTIKARLDGIPAILKRFRQSVLAAAVSGKLIGKIDVKNISLKMCVDIHNGARQPVSASLRKNIKGDTPYYGATGIVDYVNGFTHEGRFLLVGEDGANLLSKSKDLSFIVDGEVWVNNHAHVLKEKPKNSLHFIRFAINALDLSPWVTGSAQPKLTKRALELLPIPKYSIEEQTEIVRLVDQYFAFADTIEKQVQKAQQRVDKLTQSILAKAFRGELVPQDPTDEPADELLKRISAARAESEALAKAAKKVSKKK